MRRFPVLVSAAVVAAGLLLLTSAAWGVELNYRPVPPDVIILPPDRMSVTMDVLIDGRPARLIEHEGRLYLPVPRMGEEYEIRVTNHGPRRIVALVSVDGLSVIDGRPGGEWGPGYLVYPYSSIVIKGWRRDRDTVAAFSFEERHNSYAYRRGYRSDIGVIRLLAIEELSFVKKPWLRNTIKDMEATPKGDRSALGGTGTGWGRDIGSSVVYVPFVRGPYRRTIAIYYDTEDALRRAGVPVDSVSAIPLEPRYAPPPPPRRW